MCAPLNLRHWLCGIGCLPFIIALLLPVLQPSQCVAEQAVYGDVIIAPFTFDFDASLWKGKLTGLAEDVLSSSGLSLISHEQVEQELALMGATLPLSREQLVELSERLRVRACVEVIGSLQRAGSSKRSLIVCARWLDVSLRLFTRGGISKCDVGDAEAFISSSEPPEPLQRAVREAILAMLRSQPVRSQVQLQLQGGSIYITGGRKAGWRKGMDVAICRRTYNRELKRVEWQLIGFARITTVETLHAVARPVGSRFSTRNPDEAISLFVVPKELSHLAR